jgi:pyochelin biosynthesis protein PchC
VALFTSSSDLWVRRFRPQPQSTVRLVCFPHAGGSAAYYNSFSADLAPHVEVLAIQYPGRQDRYGEKRTECIPELADAVFDALLPWCDRPFALFGHSMGAVLAFEVARRLQKSGVSPLSLFLSGRRAPSRRPGGTVHLLDDVGLIAELCRVGGTDPELLADEDMRAIILPIARSDIKAAETYVCAAGAKLDGPIWALVGDADTETPIEDASAWREYTTSDFKLKVFPGGHFYLDSCREGVLATVSAALRQLAEKEATS